MILTLYRVTMQSGYVWRFAANLAEASAPLYTLGEPDEPGQKPALVSTQYQTADARHRPMRAAALLWPIENDDVDDGDEVASVKDVGEVSR